MVLIFAPLRRRTLRLDQRLVEMKEWTRASEEGG